MNESDFNKAKDIKQQIIKNELAISNMKKFCNFEQIVFVNDKGNHYAEIELFDNENQLIYEYIIDLKRAKIKELKAQFEAI